MFILNQDGLPEKPEVGKCYAKCVQKDEYRDTVARVIVKPSYKVLKVVPAKYEKK